MSMTPTSLFGSPDATMNSFSSAATKEHAKNTSVLSDMQNSGTLYATALDQQSLSYDDPSRSRNLSTSTPRTDNLSSTGYKRDFEDLDKRDFNFSCDLNASQFLIKSETGEMRELPVEVDAQSQLANKTISNNHIPDSSIIDRSDSSSEKEEVLSVEKFSEHEIAKQQKSENSTEERRKRAESLIQSRDQKLDVSLVEAMAEENEATIGDAKKSMKRENPLAGPVKQTKREIKVYDTLEEFEKNLPSTVTVLDTPFGSKVYLVGTAHFSEESQDDVSYVIRNVRPDVVLVELCPSRIHILKLDEKTLLEEAKNFNLAKIRTIIQAHGYINGIFFILLLQMSAQIAKDLGMAPGGEFRRAFEEIHKLPGCMLHLGDRPIRITLHRALRALSLWQTMKLVWRLTSTDTISIEEVEECKQQDLLEKLMQEMAGEFPAFSDVFVKERDMFLCHSLQMAALPQMPADGFGVPRPVSVVGVVGIGHANGIAKMWGSVDPQMIPPIMDIPPASLSTRVCKYTVKYGFVGLTLFGVYMFLKPRLMRAF